MKRDSWLSETVQDFIETEDYFADRDLPHPRHRGLVGGPPVVHHPGPVGLVIVLPAEALKPPPQARPPVHNGAEDVEQQDFHLACISLGQCCTSPTLSECIRS